MARSLQFGEELHEDGLDTTPAEDAIPVVNLR